MLAAPDFRKFPTPNLNVAVSLSTEDAPQGATLRGRWGAPYDVYLGDLNGDGKSDILGRDYSTGTVYVSTSSGSRFAEPAAWGVWDLGYDMHVADVNGDGRADIVGRDFETGEVQAALSSGHGFQAPSSWSDWGADEYDLWSPEYELYLADENGDGKADLVGLNELSGDLRVGLSDGQRFQDSTSWGAVDLPQDQQASFDEEMIRFADVNDDDRADLVARGVTDGSWTDRVDVSLSGGQQFGEASAWGVLPLEYDLNAGDVNGDGRADLVGHNSSGGGAGPVQVGFSDGQEFGFPTAWGTWNTHYDYHLADTNADGMIDQVGRTPAGRAFTAPVYNPNIDTYELPCESGGERVAIPRSSLGSSFEGLPQTESAQRCNDEDIGQRLSGPYTYYTVQYGDCVVAEEATGCVPPLEVQTWPACEVSRELFQYYEDPIVETQVEGDPAFVLADGHIDVFTRAATVKVFGDDPAQVRRAAESLTDLPDQGTVQLSCTAYSD